MKSKMIIFLGAMGLMLGLVGAPASWANSLTFQGVTFNLTEVDSNTLQLNILNAESTTNPNWADAEFLKNIGLKDIGTVGGATLTGFSVTSLELNANGCGGGDSGGFCFTSNLANGVAVTDNMTFTIDFATGALNLDAPHLKVRFLDATGTKEGSLLSQTIPPGTSVPEPASLMLLGAGLAGLGIWRRKVSKG
ncbi:MAG: PEP-CTERM sorting domain-containing protein [Nitrospirales bacterium]